MAYQSRFRTQTEALLTEVASDPKTAISERSAIIYETCVELINELLAEPDLATKSPRLENVSRAITSLVMNDPTAFSHLFAASHHDFYTATHMVNVATWMVPVAYAMGHHGTAKLNTICQAGMLHDMGKMNVPEEILNKKGKLTDEDWAVIKQHPEKGAEYLGQYDNIDPLVLAVTLQHHERLDGSGYPSGLTADEIDQVSKICAVVDSFDAMTAFRPFKSRTLSVAQAIDILKKETPSKYDPEVMEAWLGLLSAVEPAACSPDWSSGDDDGPARKQDRRGDKRTTFHCSARVHIMEWTSKGWKERPGIPATAHTISRSGFGFLSQVPLPVGYYVRIYPQVKDWSRNFLDGQVVRLRSYRDAWYEVGLQLVKTIPKPGDTCTPPPVAAAQPPGTAS